MYIGTVQHLRTIYVYMYICVCIHVYIYIHMYVDGGMYIYIYRKSSHPRAAEEGKGLGTKKRAAGVHDLDGRVEAAAFTGVGLEVLRRCAVEASSPVFRAQNQAGSFLEIWGA